MELVDFLIASSPVFLFVLVRTGSILLTAPVFGAFMVPMQVKMGIIIMIALILTPLTAAVELPQTLTALVLSLAGEALIGITIGLVIRFIFTGIEFAGQIASFQMGIGMASAYDPMNSAQVTVLGRMMSILTLLIFLSVDGHVMVVMALKRCFEVIPPYGLIFSGELVEGIVLFSREIFILAIKFSAPVVAILLFANISLGIIARTVPQINMFVIGFSVTILAGFVMIAMSFDVFDPMVRTAFDDMWIGVGNLITVMSRG